MFNDKRITDLRNEKTKNIDSLEGYDILKVLNDEDKTVAHCVEKDLKNIARASEAVIYAVKNGGRIFYVGAGTSGRLGIMDAVDCSTYYGIERKIFIPLIAGGDKALKESVPQAQDDRNLAANELRDLELKENDVVIGISSSGNTPYVIGALDYGRKHGAKTICITNTIESEVSQVSDIPITIIVGPEAITFSTRLKSATAVKMVLNMLSTVAMIKSGKVYENLLVDIIPESSKLMERRLKVVMEVTGLNEEDAEQLVKKAGGNTKTAIVMHLTGKSKDETEKLLDRYNGNIREVLSHLSNM